MKTVAIMQPTYLPWLGYFDLMDQSDVFVWLDSVQFEKRSWQQRNRIKTSAGEQWLTVPVLSKGKFDQKICVVEIDKQRNFSKQHVKALELAYIKSKYFNKYFSKLKLILTRPHKLLVDLNLELIRWLADELGLSPFFLRSSELNVTGKRAELLVNICKTVAASKYISPIGAADYLKTGNVFTNQGIEFAYHQYRHPVYEQLYDEFLPFMSVIDLLFSQGENSLTIIRSGRKS